MNVRIPTLVAALIASVLAGCTLPSVPKNYLPQQSEIPGQWCSAGGDRLTLDPAGTAAVTLASKDFADDILDSRNEYPRGYWLATTFHGRIPAAAAGSWSVHHAQHDALDSHDSSVSLTVTAFGTVKVNDVVDLYFDGPKPFWGFSVLRAGYTAEDSGYFHVFDRCRS